MWKIYCFVIDLIQFPFFLFENEATFEFKINSRNHRIFDLENFLRRIQVFAYTFFLFEEFMNLKGGLDAEVDMEIYHERWWHGNAKGP